MAGGSSLYKDTDVETISDINVTPLVDVMLVLLVIFMVTAPLIAARGILVNSPTTVSGEPAASPLKVSLDKDDHLYINGTEYPDREAAKAELARRAKAQPDLKAIVAADTDISYGRAMLVIDLVKQAGISKFTLATRRPTPQ
jgi:biopolymer transport protein ExbD